MRQRISVRSYDGRALPLEVLDPILAKAQQANSLTDQRPRIALVSGAEQARRVLTFTVGSYGLIQNPPHVLAGVLPEDSESSRINLGYMLEQTVLEATMRGLGTCWVTGTFDAARAGDAVGLEPGETVTAVCPLGYPAESRLRRFHTQTVRRLARGHQRKPLAEIVYAQHWGGAWSPEGADRTWLTVLEGARLAPSAANRQPWRFIVRQADLVLATTQAAPIDAGIAMAHVMLAAHALGWNGHWQLRVGDAELAQECQLPPSVLLVGVFA